MLHYHCYLIVYFLSVHTARFLHVVPTCRSKLIHYWNIILSISIWKLEDRYNLYICRHIPCKPMKLCGTWEWKIGDKMCVVNILPLAVVSNRSTWILRYFMCKWYKLFYQLKVQIDYSYINQRGMLWFLTRSNTFSFLLCMNRHH